MRFNSLLVSLTVWLPAPAIAAEVLPTTLIPEHYELAVVPDANALVFTGTVAITGAAPLAGRQIVLNARDLAFDSVELDGIAARAVHPDAELGRVRIEFAAPFAAGRHVLHIAYHGPIAKTGIGLSAMDYDSVAGPQRIIATNFEPADARRFLPCWDEPGLKATFTVTVDTPADRLAVSNMPVASRESLPGGQVRVHFAPSPRMSTYLLFLGVGDFERIGRNVDGVNLGVVVRRGDTAKAAYALEEAARLLHFYDDWFGVRFALPKLDLVAAPGAVSGGSMENWGAILFSQDDVLFDPAATTEEERQRIFSTVAHEMAHQWFGDLVTMAWWDNLWLNEGFAQWMQAHAADALHPQWQTGLQAAQVYERGKRADASITSHPILHPVNSADQAVEAFDSITYNKGAAVISMLETYVGPEAFQAGVRHYMQTHAYGSTTDADLWSQIAAASGKPLLDTEHDFTRQTGVPLIRVEPAGDGWHLTVRRFAEDPAAPGVGPVPSWRIPLSVASAAGSRTDLVLEGPQELTDPAPLVNAGAMAYVRVFYPQGLVRSLAGRMGSLAPLDQLNLMNDAWALGQAGYAPARNLLEFIARLPDDANPIVWTRAVALLDEIDDAYGRVRERARYRRAALGLLGPPAARIGAVTPGEAANLTTLRAVIWRSMARFGDAAALARARSVYTGTAGSIAERRTALQIVAAAADSAQFDALLAQVRQSRDPLAKARLLRAMAGVEDPKLAMRMVDIAFGPEAPASTAEELIGLAAQRNPDAVWDGLRPWFAAGPLPIETMDRWTLIPQIAGRSADPRRIGDIRRFGAQDMPADARRPVQAAVSHIRLNQRVQRHALPDIGAWVATR